MPPAKRGPRFSVQDVIAIQNGETCLHEGQNYKIYADNYFTCVPLVVKLLDRGIHYVGTARQVRLPNCNLEEEKSLKKKGRGSFDIRVEANHNICAVKWYDSRAVTLVSSFAGPDPVQRIQRWDKANKTYVEVERPYIVGTYNKYMGGVDLLDSFTAKYKFPMKSDAAGVQALKMPKQEILNRRQFQADLASSLILVNTTPLKTPKRGRPSSGNGSPAATVTSRSPLNAQKRPSSGDGSPPNGAPSKRSQPPLDVRKDLMAHFPVKTREDAADTARYSLLTASLRRRSCSRRRAISRWSMAAGEGGGGAGCCGGGACGEWVGGVVAGGVGDCCSGRRRVSSCTLRGGSTGSSSCRSLSSFSLAARLNCSKLSEEDRTDEAGVD
ncbi:hypothetical protein F7725_006286 [Dissostichus mawsoni]|uniref:PiggyBac transposable element-derived protein domain-containing protein n=1 Tax=Dissostichus mawsoni TaxID=36200 RepID=A0A7J5YVS9_DISMA|nr:hypothetical protein F7725_006286 [Dissostichus mawsoni]